MEGSSSTEKFVPIVEFTCSSCGFIFSRQNDLTDHFVNCKGIDKIDVDEDIVKHELSDEEFNKLEFPNEPTETNQTFDIKCGDVEFTEYNISGSPHPKIETTEELCDDTPSLKQTTKPFTCTICNHASAHRSHISRHMRMHTANRSFVCTVCDYACSRSDALRRHMRTHIAKKSFACTKCDYACSRSDGLSRHMKVHVVEKSFICTVCDYAGMTECNHARQTTTKSFACTLCDYVCYRSYSFSKHMDKHKRQKPFECTVCDYTCTQSSHLISHMVTHDKPFKCTICDYASTARSTLRSHMKRHTEKNLLKCTVCDSPCANQRDLRIHMRTHAKIPMLRNFFFSEAKICF